MGVYVFRSLVRSYIKVGHYVGHDAWGRVARRGFHSCVRPWAMKDHVNAEHLELVAWFPVLKTRDERVAHKMARALVGGEPSVGEWHDARHTDAILHVLHERSVAAGGGGSQHDMCDLASSLVIKTKKKRPTTLDLVPER